ncbi:hypothetical protein [Duganella sp. BuS-21]|uniref:hypothetical protein n=1 Tax=Duganella sp. BuS-21 TaxID=2943848 RepID=UPI0035A5B155
MSPIAMVMRRAHWQGAAAQHAHAHHHSWLVQAILRAGSPSASSHGRGMLRMIERHGRTVQMISRVLQALPARMQVRPAGGREHAAQQSAAAGAASTRPVAMPTTVAATLQRVVANGAGAYPHMPMTMARSGATPASGAAQRPETPAHLATVPGAGSRNGHPARSPSAFAAAPQPVTLAPLELARVTDHVVTQLEQRALSYRERMGGR